jgi:hypothetical protein
MLKAIPANDKLGKYGEFLTDVNRYAESVRRFPEDVAVLEQFYAESVIGKKATPGAINDINAAFLATRKKYVEAQGLARDYQLQLMTMLPAIQTQLIRYAQTTTMANDEPFKKLLGDFATEAVGALVIKELSTHSIKEAVPVWKGLYKSITKADSGMPELGSGIEDAKGPDLKTFLTNALGAVVEKWKTAYTAILHSLGDETNAAITALKTRATASRKSVADTTVNQIPSDAETRAKDEYERTMRARLAVMTRGTNLLESLQQSLPLDDRIKAVEGLLTHVDNYERDTGLTVQIIKNTNAISEMQLDVRATVERTKAKVLEAVAKPKEAIIELDRLEAEFSDWVPPSLPTERPDGDIKKAKVRCARHFSR